MPVKIRGPRKSDRPALRALVESTGVFVPVEVEAAVELFDAALVPGQPDGYHVLVLEDDGEFAAYACFGHVPMTETTFDLYWIAVSPARHGRGLGRRMLAAVYDAVRAMGGRKIIAETSDKPGYEATNAFYRATGWEERGRIPDFYRPGDTKVTYVRDVPPTSESPE
ncbi:MAG: GNAT family N-acetyltransferase [Planctomycetes bacterium]|nr:GNAT family N-acetyltransferase [Planctomycetota bacterium]MBI3846757.1 GNAT family N-acetyltransferase [Planctomycetota bacterium]